VIHKSYVPLVCVPCEPCGSALEGARVVAPTAKAALEQKNQRQKDCKKFKRHSGTWAGILRDTAWGSC